MDSEALSLRCECGQVQGRVDAGPAYTRATCYCRDCRAYARWLDRRHLERTHAFYERHGGKAIIIARFVPIVRTYVPFVAGVGAMPYARFLAFSVAGALLWVVSLTQAGYWFGNIPAVKDNLAAVIVLIVAISVLPIALEFLRAWRRRAAARAS